MNIQKRIIVIMQKQLDEDVLYLTEWNINEVTRIKNLISKDKQLSFTFTCTHKYTPCKN